MIFREAVIADIPQIQIIRHSVRENILSDPSLVTDADCENYLTVRGKGWVCEIQKTIVGFSIVDLQENNVWAIFLHHHHEKKGVGKQLHDIMVDWYFTQSTNTLWLGTEPNTRAEKFYELQGWERVGIHGKGEIKFEMSFENWGNIKI